VSGPLKRYEVTLPGGRKTVMKLNEADAERYDATPIDGEQPTAPSTTEEKAGTAENKSRTTSNKARTSRTKAASGGDD